MNYEYNFMLPEFRKYYLLGLTNLEVTRGFSSGFLKVTKIKKNYFCNFID